MRAIFLVLLTTLGTAWGAFGQLTVSGVVVDATTSEPLLGVRVRLEAHDETVLTDRKGFFMFAPETSGTRALSFEKIGYWPTSRGVEVDDSRVVLTVALNRRAFALDEHVEVMPGQLVPRYVSGAAVRTIRAEESNRAGAREMSDLLLGQIPGVLVLTSGGLTGEGTRLRLRGLSTMTQNAEPVVYLNGARIDPGGGFGGIVAEALGMEVGGGASVSRLDDLDPSIVDRIEVLRGPAAAALYGADAANGVVRILTKRGRLEPARLRVEAWQGTLRSPGTIPANTGFARDLYDAQGQLLMSAEALADTMSTYLGRTVRPYELVRQNTTADLLGVGRSRAFRVSLRGGDPVATYYLSIRHTADDGPFDAHEDRGYDAYPADVEAETRAEDIVRRTQLSALLEVTPRRRLSLDATVFLGDTRLRTFYNNNNVYGIPAAAMLASPIRVREGNPDGAPPTATINELLQTSVHQRAEQVHGTVGATLYLLPQLRAYAGFGVNNSFALTRDIRPPGWAIDEQARVDTAGIERITRRGFRGITYQANVVWGRATGRRFNASFVAGLTGSKDEEEITGAYLFGSDEEETLADAALNLEVARVGGYIRQYMGLGDVVSAMAGLRIDGSSAFGETVDAVLYPQASLVFQPSGWSFWPRATSVPHLRIRAAWGQAGRPPGPLDARTTYGTVPTPNGPGVVPISLGNPGLRPERSRERELGLDVNLADRLGLEVTYWRRDVTDALLARRFSVTGGFRSVQFVNLAEVQGKGLDVSVDASLWNNRQLNLRLFAHAAYLWEQVTDLGGLPPLKAGGSYPEIRNLVQEGYAPGAHFGAKLLEPEQVGSRPDGRLPFDTNRDGEPDTEADLLAYVQTLTPATASLDELNTFVLLADDDGDGDLYDHYLGKPRPDWQGGVGGVLRIGALVTISTLFEYRRGSYFVNDLTGAFRQAHPELGRNLPQAAALERDYITGGLDNAGEPLNDPDVRLQAAQRWVEEFLATEPFSGLNTVKPADWLRWRSLRITVNLPGQLTTRLRLREASVTLAGENLALFTDYTGLDPEINAFGRFGTTSRIDQALVDGVEAFGLPVPRRVTLGLRVVL